MMAVNAAYVAPPAYYAQLTTSPSPQGCYRESRPLGPTGGAVAPDRDAPFAAIMLRARGRVVFPEVAEGERGMWESRSEWSARGDTLTVLIFTGLQGWRARFTPNGDGWRGGAVYLSDAVNPNDRSTFGVSVSLARTACPAAWSAITPAPMTRLAGMPLYFAEQVDEQAKLKRGSRLPNGVVVVSADEKRPRTVVVQLVVTDAGSVVPDRIKVLRSDDRALSNTALRIVPTLQFDPALVNQRRVGQLVQLAMAFPP